MHLQSIISKMDIVRRFIKNDIKYDQQTNDIIYSDEE